MSPVPCFQWLVGLHKQLEVGQLLVLWVCGNQSPTSLKHGCMVLSMLLPNCLMYNMEMSVVCTFLNNSHPSDEYWTRWIFTQTFISQPFYDSKCGWQVLLLRNKSQLSLTRLNLWTLVALFPCKSLQLNPSILETSFGHESDIHDKNFQVFSFNKVLSN